MSAHGLTFGEVDALAEVFARLLRDEPTAVEFDGGRMAISGSITLSASEHAVIIDVIGEENIGVVLPNDPEELARLRTVAQDIERERG